MRGIFDLDSPLIRGLGKLLDCICLSLLWLVFCLPVVTIGAASAALYGTVYHYLRQGEGHLWSTFWGAFREELKRSTLIWLIVLLVLAVLTVDALVFRSFALEGRLLGRIYWLALVLMGAAVTWTAYLFSYAARFEGRVRDVLRLALVLMLMHPLRALGVFAPMLIAFLVVVTVPGLLAMVPAAVCWLQSVSLEAVFRLHMPPEDAETAVSDAPAD